MKFIPIILLALVLTACSTSHSVIVNTATVLGVAVAENPSTSLYEARFGYARTEFAYVPSNRGRSTNEVTTGQGAKDVADVILEIRMENLLKGGLIYQRLAVGENAVKQPGAALLFAKSPDGTIDPAVARAISEVPAVNTTTIQTLSPLAKAFQESNKKEAFDAVARRSGYENFSAFLTDKKPSADKVKAITEELRNIGLVPVVP